MKLESEPIWAQKALRGRERAESEKAQKSSNLILEIPASQKDLGPVFAILPPSPLSLPINEGRGQYC